MMITVLTGTNQIWDISTTKKICLFVFFVFYKTSGEDSLKSNSIFYQKFHLVFGFFVVFEVKLWLVYHIAVER